MDTNQDGRIDSNDLHNALAKVSAEGSGLQLLFVDRGGLQLFLRDGQSSGSRGVRGALSNAAHEPGKGGSLEYTQPHASLQCEVIGGAAQGYNPLVLCSVLSSPNSDAYCRPFHPRCSGRRCH